MATLESTEGSTERESAAVGALLKPRASQAFADDLAGSDYFRSEEHHRHLAATILQQLGRGDGFLLVSGEPPADSELLERLLNDQRDHERPATLVRCRPGMSFRDIVRAYNRGLGLRQAGGSDGVWSLLSELMLEVRKGAKRVLIIDNAEALDAAALEELVRFTRLDEPHVMSVVLLGGGRFGKQLTAPPFDLIDPLIIARIASNRLEPEEVPAFIRLQLIAESKEDKVLFPLETVSAISAAAGGDPAIVNTLCRELLSETASSPDDSTAVAALPEMPGTSLEPTVAVRQEATAEPILRAQAEERRISQLSRHPALKAPTSRRIWVSITVGAFAMSLSGLGLLYFMGPRDLLEGPMLVSAWSAAQRVLAPVSAVYSSHSQALGVGEAAPSATAAKVSAAVEPTAGGPSEATAEPAHEPLASRPVAVEGLQANYAPSVQASEATTRKARRGVDDTTVNASAANPIALVDRTTSSATTESRASPRPIGDSATAAALGKAVEAPLTSQDVTPVAPSTSRALDPMHPAGSVEPRITMLEVTPAPVTMAHDTPSPDVAIMVRRGNELLTAGDVVSARSFFERGAQTGDPAALCGIAKTYDTLFLRQLGTRGVSGDAATAIAWYRRAVAAGSAEASARLTRLQAIAFPH